MLASSNNCTAYPPYACGWMQSGYFRSHGTAKVHFAQIYNFEQWGGIPQNVLGSTVANGEIHQYWQQRAPEAGNPPLEYHSNVDTTRFINTETGLLTHGWTGYSEQFFNETRYKSSDVPGSVTTHVPFYNLQVQRTDLTWQLIPNPFLTSANDNPARWHVSPTSGTSFDIWTNPSQ